MNTETEKYHHPFSPSKLSSLEFCPCYESRTGTHIKAAIGTMQHKVTETAEDDLRLSDDEAAAAAECLDFVEKQRNELEEARQKAIANWTQSLTTAKPEIPPVQEIKEIYLPVDKVKLPWGNLISHDGTRESILHNGTTGGWLDTLLLSHDRRLAIAFDWKFGRWAVDAAENNLQGICYALGIFLAYSTVERVRFYFKQPHINKLTHADFTRADIPRLYTRVLVVVARAMEAQQGEEPKWEMANPGYPTCMFCNRIGYCPKVTQLALNVSKKYWPAGVPANVTPNAIVQPSERAARLQVAKILEVWCKAMRRQESERSLRNGNCPEGYRLATKTPRVIVDQVKYKEVALRYLTEAEFESTLDYEFGKVEALVKDKAIRGQKETALKKLDQDWRDAGAVKDGQTYSFLQAISEGEEEQKPKQ